MSQRYHMFLEALETKNMNFLSSICDHNLYQKLEANIEKFPKVTRQGDRELTRVELVSARLEIGWVDGLPFT